MTVRPGPHAITVAGVILITSLGVFVTPLAGYVCVGIGVVALCVSVVEFLELRRRLLDLDVERKLPVVVGRGRPFTVAWTLKRTVPGSVAGEFRDGLPSGISPSILTIPFVMAGSEFQITDAETFNMATRGRFEFGPFWVRLAGRFGLLECHREWPLPGSVRVFPESYHSPDELVKETGMNVLLDKSTRAREQGAGTEFASLSEFRDGDDPRRIDWRTTARTGRLIMRRFQIERHRDVMLLVDCGRLMGADAGKGSKLDCAIDAALTLARVALQGSDRCGMALFDDQVLGYLSPVAGLSSLGAIAECVYAAETRWRESDFSQMFATLQQRHAKRSLVIVISDMVDSETTLRFRASLARLAQRHVVLFAALRTPVLEEITSSPLADELDASRKAIAFQLLREREHALHAVRRCGVHVLDVTPSQLVAPLINQFLDLRQRSVI